MPIEGLLGRKLGMTQVFDGAGKIHAVTVVEAGPMVVTQVKTVVKDGYDAVQVGYGEKKKLNKPMRGRLRLRLLCDQRTQDDAVCVQLLGHRLRLRLHESLLRRAISAPQRLGAAHRINRHQ